MIVPPQGDIIGPGLQATNIPFVITGTRGNDAGVPSVDVDNAIGAEHLVDYLIGQGHRRIALLTPDGGPQFSFVSERATGYRRALEARSLTTDPVLVRSHEFGPMGVRPAVEALMKLPKPQRPTALFCVYDLAALDALAVLRGMGLSVPRDISVAGFDDVPSAATSMPQLTTVRQPFREIGGWATRKLLARIATGDGGAELLPTEIAIRTSVAPPRQS